MRVLPASCLFLNEAWIAFASNLLSKWTYICFAHSNGSAPKILRSDFQYHCKRWQLQHSEWRHRHYCMLNINEVFQKVYYLIGRVTMTFLAWTVYKVFYYKIIEWKADRNGAGSQWRYFIVHFWQWWFGRNSCKYFHLMMINNRPYCNAISIKIVENLLFVSVLITTVSIKLSQCKQKQWNCKFVTEKFFLMADISDSRSWARGKRSFTFIIARRTDRMERRDRFECQTWRWRCRFWSARWRST